MEVWKKIKEVYTSGKNLTALTISNFFSMAILGIFWFVIAKIVNVEDYGFLSYHIAAASITTAIALPGLTNTILVYVGRDKKITSPMFTIGLISLVIASIILYFVMNNFASSLYVIGQGIFGLIGASLLASKRFGEFSKVTIIQRIVSIALSILFYYWIGLDGIILGLAVSFFIYSKKFYGDIRGNMTKFNLLKPYQKNMINNYGFDISRILTTQIDKLIIFPFFGFVTLGNYYFAFQILSIAIIIPGTIFQYILPQESKEKSFKNLKKFAIIFSVIITFVTITTAPVIIPIVFPKYLNALIMIQVMILSIIPQTISLMYISKFLSKNMNNTVLRGSLIFISAQILFIIALGNIVGVYGVALALVLACIFELAYLYLQNHKLEAKSL